MKIITLFIFSIWFLPFSLLSQKLHLFVVSATNDATIGNYCKINKENIISVFTQMCEQAEMELHTIDLSGNEATTTNIAAQIANLQTGKDDAIIFQYSGHGANNGNLWPFLLIPGKKLGLEDIHNSLCKKNARLTLTIGDCCNFGSEATFVSKDNATRKSINNYGNVILKNNCNLLLRQSALNLLAASSERGQFSQYIQNIGGLYTSSLVDALLAIMKNKKNTEVQWETVFKNTQKLTVELSNYHGKSQTPIYQLNPTSKEVVSPAIATADIPNTGTTIQYIVKSGDTYLKIAEKYVSKQKFQGGIYKSKVAELGKKIAVGNNNKNIIKPGDILLFDISAYAD